MPSRLGGLKDTRLFREPETHAPAQKRQSKTDGKRVGGLKGTRVVRESETSVKAPEHQSKIGNRGAGESQTFVASYFNLLYVVLVRESETHTPARKRQSNTGGKRVGGRKDTWAVSFCRNKSISMSSMRSPRGAGHQNIVGRHRKGTIWHSTTVSSLSPTGRKR